MRTAEPLTESQQVHRLAENLMGHFAKGREWATPGVQAAVQRAVAGLDSGIETASPRLQALLRRLAEELAGGVETFTPRVQERLRHVGPKTTARNTKQVPVQVRRPALSLWWWAVGIVALAAGAAAWRSAQASKKEPAPVNTQEGERAVPNADPDLTAGRM